jgi:hypothetical protein
MRRSVIQTGWRHRLSRDPRRVVEVADRLAGEQRSAEAVEMLTRANRKLNDPELAARIVDLRFAAFRHVQQTGGAPPPLPPPPDLFQSKFPEVSRHELTPETLRSAILHHGFLLVRGFADDADAERLTRDIEHAFAACDAAQHGGVTTSPDHWFRRFEHDRTSDRATKRSAGCVLAVDSPPAMFDVIEVFERSGVGRLARGFFGEAPALLAKKWSLRKVTSDANTGDWHQDGAFMGEGIRSLNVWLTMSHCGDTAPGIDLVARRIDHVLETGTEGAYFQWSIGPPVAERAAAGHIVRPIFERGDALLFDHLLVHRTAVDPPMTNDRYAIEAWFLAPSTYGEMLSGAGQTYASRDQIPLFY